MNSISQQSRLVAFIHYDVYECITRNFNYNWRYPDNEYYDTMPITASKAINENRLFVEYYLQVKPQYRKIALYEQTTKIIAKKSWQIKPTITYIKLPTKKM